MEPIYFPQFNKVLTKPDSMTDDQCGSLPINTDGRSCISCWKMTFRERLNALVFGRVWLWVYSGKTQPPVGFVVGKDAFVSQGRLHG